MELQNVSYNTVLRFLQAFQYPSYFYITSVFNKFPFKKEQINMCIYDALESLNRNSRHTTNSVPSQVQKRA